MGLTIGLDTNILIDAHDRRGPAKHEVAQTLAIHLIEGNAGIAGRILGEFLRVTHKKRPMPLDVAREVVGTIEETCRVLECIEGTRRSASLSCEKRGLQYFDALICTVLVEHSQTILLSEDMQDGLQIGPLKVVNPFNPSNAGLIAEAFV
jgi:predicted nucleic acid-binding protein